MNPDYEVPGRYQLWHGNCLEEMGRIESGSVDMILADLPFNSTDCTWDKMIPFEPLWKYYKRIIKPHRAIVLFGTQPFTTLLIANSPEFGTKKQWFKYDWVWKKNKPTGSLNAHRQPMRSHESILVFASGVTVYNPQKVLRTAEEYKASCRANDTIYGNQDGIYGKKERMRIRIRPTAEEQWYRHPDTVLSFPRDEKRNGTNHPTQKPVALLSYLIKTYTNEGETVLDNTCGSGSTLEAAMRCNRRSIGIEKDAGYFEIASQRLARVAAELRGELGHLPLFAEAA